MSSAIESLMFCARISSKKLKDLTLKLDDAAPRRIQGILRGIETESTVLSQSIQKLSAYMDVMKADENAAAPKGPVASDNRLLEIVGLLRAAEQGQEQAVCDACGGIKNDVGDHSHFANDNPQNGFVKICSRERAEQVHSDEG